MKKVNGKTFIPKVGGQRRKTIFIICMLAFPLAQFAFFYVFMNFNNLRMAFMGYNTDGSTYWAGFDNFTRLFHGVDTEVLLISFWNNLRMFFWTLVIGMPLNILFGFYLFKKKPGHKVIRIVYMLPSMVSGVVMTLLFMKLVEVGLPIGYHELFGKEMPNLLRDNSTAFGVQVFYTLWLGFSTSIIYYSNAMFNLDPAMFEAAKIDGASSFTQLTRIVVPMIMPMLSTYLITGVASIFTVSGSLFLFYGLNDVPLQTYMTGYYLFRIAMIGDLTAYPTASATSIVITIITIPLSFLTRKLCDVLNPLKEVQKDIA